jgi:hypothetical protein
MIVEYTDDKKNNENEDGHAGADDDKVDNSQRMDDAVSQLDKAS